MTITLLLSKTLLQQVAVNIVVNAFSLIVFTDDDTVPVLLDESSSLLALWWETLMDSGSGSDDRQASNMAWPSSGPDQCWSSNMAWPSSGPDQCWSSRILHYGSMTRVSGGYKGYPHGCGPQVSHIHRREGAHLFQSHFHYGCEYLLFCNIYYQQTLGNSIYLQYFTDYVLNP